MNKHLKHHIAAITAAATLLALLTTAAPARNFSTSNQTFRVAWNELEFGTPTLTVSCSVTLEGSFHYRTIVKRERTLIGYITRVAVRRPCTNGEAWAANGTESHPRLGTLANTLPWHLTYEGFEGTLPCITSLLFLLRGVRFKIHAPFNTLGLYGAAEDNITARAVRNPTTRVITELEPLPGRSTIRLVNCLGGICPASGTSGRAGQVFLLNTTTRITITLI